MPSRPEHVLGDVRGVRIALIDNYSSFTQNLVHYLEQVTGRTPLVVANNSDVPCLDDIHGIVISPGPGTPEEANDAGMCLELLAQRVVPVLGICFGHQALGVLAGATLVRAEEPFHGRVSEVSHSGHPLFAGVPASFRTTRYHSLTLLDPLPAALECIARTGTGDIMAIRHRDAPHYGVQFHPESIASEYGRVILENFCRIVRDCRTQVATDTTPRARRSQVVAGRPKNCWVASVRSCRPKASPEAVFSALYDASETAFWLDGTSGESISYMGDASGPHGYLLRYRVEGGQLRYSQGRDGTLACQSVFDYIEAELARAEPRGVPPKFKFTGGFVGYLGYELKGILGATNAHRSPWPDAELTWVDRYVAFDHASGEVTLVSLRPEGSDASACSVWLDVSLRAIESAAPPKRVRWEEVQLAWRDTEQEYSAHIKACREQICAGESYELCLTTQLQAEAAVDGYELFLRMRASNPAPYSAYLRGQSFAIASASPERFLKVTADGVVESKPIKGTASRGRTAYEDQKNAEELASSEKERAENLMIVDLVRHDLSHVCEVGSVVVTANAHIETYATVHQLVSTVQGKLRKDATSLACVAAAFPGGSMTGAPKKRSMEILDRIETGPRGPYSGSIGYLSTSGAVDLSIVIRSALVEANRVHLGVGGAITALSEPASEVREVELKAKAQRRALAGNASK